MNMFRCYRCNKFMSYRDLDDCVSLIRWGYPWEEKEPDEEFIHRECWNELDKKWKESYRHSYRFYDRLEEQNC